MSFRLVPKSATLNDLERRNGRNILRYFTEFGNHESCVRRHNRVDLWRNLCTSLLYFALRARCRRKESSRSLSHLLMSFLLQFINILLSCDHFISSSVISLMVEGVSFLRISVSVTSSINFWHMATAPSSHL